MRNDNRVLAYTTARTLTDEELAFVSGGLAATGTSVSDGNGDSCDDDNGDTTVCPEPN